MRASHTKEKNGKINLVLEGGLFYVQFKLSRNTVDLLWRRNDESVEFPIYYENIPSLISNLKFTYEQQKERQRNKIRSGIALERLEKVRVQDVKPRRRKTYKKIL